jgi:hypothetical protein
VGDVALGRLGTCLVEQGNKVGGDRVTWVIFELLSPPLNTPKLKAHHFYFRVLFTAFWESSVSQIPHIAVPFCPSSNFLLLSLEGRALRISLAPCSLLGHNAHRPSIG